MEGLTEFILANKHWSHWLIFGSVLLAGLNIPISIDVMMIITALLAAHIVPENLTALFCAMLIGCLLSAWIAYWLGRLAGPKITQLPLVRTALSEKRIAKTKQFYDRYGLWTFMVGRFIPLGVRNCIFMSSGLSRMPFLKFILFDFLACTVWAGTTFYLFYIASSHYSTLISSLKWVNIAIGTLAVAVIGCLWYKKKKHT